MSFLVFQKVCNNYCTTVTSTEISPSDLSELTKSFEFTTEPQAEESDKKDSEEDYEVVPADSCDDGEWVDVLGVVVSQNIPSYHFSVTIIVTTGRRRRRRNRTN